MKDKKAEQALGRKVIRGFCAVMRDLGFERETDRSCVCKIRGHTCKVWIQKFVLVGHFRVVMSFRPNGGGDSDWVTEFADRYTRRGCPGGRQYDFRVGFGDDAPANCLREIRDFVRNIAFGWFEQQADRLS